MLTNFIIYTYIYSVYYHVIFCKSLIILVILISCLVAFFFLINVFAYIYIQSSFNCTPNRKHKLIEFNFNNLAQLLGLEGFLRNEECQRYQKDGHSFWFGSNKLRNICCEVNKKSNKIATGHPTWSKNFTPSKKIFFASI